MLLLLLLLLHTYDRQSNVHLRLGLEQHHVDHIDRQVLEQQLERMPELADKCLTFETLRIDRRVGVAVVLLVVIHNPPMSRHQHAVQRDEGNDAIEPWCVAHKDCVVKRFVANHQHTESAHRRARQSDNVTTHMHTIPRVSGVALRTRTHQTVWRQCSAVAGGRAQRHGRASRCGACR
jgi:hypothetical protein